MPGLKVIEYIVSALNPTRRIRDLDTSSSARFRREKTETRVLAAARKKTKAVWRGVRVRLVQDCAPEVLEKRKKFDGVRALLQQRKIVCALRFPAFMTASVNNKLHELSSPAEAKRFISGLPPIQVEEDRDQVPSETEETA